MIREHSPDIDEQQSSVDFDIDHEIEKLSQEIEEIPSIDLNDTRIADLTKVSLRNLTLN